MRVCHLWLCSCAPVSCKNEQKQHENNLVLKVVNTIKNTVLHGTFTLCVVSSTAHPSSFQGEYSCKIHNVKKSTPVVSYLTALQNMTGQILLCNYAFFFVLLSWWYIFFLIKMYSQCIWYKNGKFNFGNRTSKLKIEKVLNEELTISGEQFSIDTFHF